MNMNMRKKNCLQEEIFLLKELYANVISNVIELDGENYLQVGQNYIHLNLDLKHGWINHMSK